MAKITKVTSGGGHSYKVTIPKEKAERFIKKHGKEINITEWGEGFKITPKEWNHEILQRHRR